MVFLILLFFQFNLFGLRVSKRILKKKFPLHFTFKNLQIDISDGMEPTGIVSWDKQEKLPKI